ncbi:hypothetical protein GGI26_000678 [Coemansia sp. RSA 1358]|nr:hypothetical protein EDC05_002175 [Coemansia umbellata]KAJ2625209.1 hypothetical protein GGI26_000678 [Coemansia sp. RSA 1358]
MVLALASLFPVFLVVMETTIVLSRREATGILLLIGQLLNEASNLILKSVIQHDRPNLHLGDGYGMPSSHSQFMAFFASYTIIYLESRIVTSPIHKRVVQAGAVVLGLLVMFSRIYLGYHTAPQVIAGGLVGLVSGCFWLWFVEYVIYPSGFVAFVLDWPVCQWLLLRDSRCISDIALAEYRLSRQAAIKVKVK